MENRGKHKLKINENLLQSLMIDTSGKRLYKPVLEKVLRIKI